MKSANILDRSVTLETCQIQKKNSKCVAFTLLSIIEKAMLNKNNNIEQNLLFSISILWVFCDLFQLSVGNVHVTFIVSKVLVSHGYVWKTIKYSNLIHFKGVLNFTAKFEQLLSSKGNCYTLARGFDAEHEKARDVRAA